MNGHWKVITGPSGSYSEVTGRASWLGHDTFILWFIVGASVLSTAVIHTISSSQEGGPCGDIVSRSNRSFHGKYRNKTSLESWIEITVFTVYFIHDAQWNFKSASSVYLKFSLTWCIISQEFYFRKIWYIHASCVRQNMKLFCWGPFSKNLTYLVCAGGNLSFLKYSKESRGK